MYLSAIQDLYNNEVVAWHLSERNDLLLVTKTVDMLCEKTDLTDALLHSDQGFQYTSKPFNRKLADLESSAAILDVETALTMPVSNRSFHI